MIYKYPSPVGEVYLTADEAGLTALWFEGQTPHPDSGIANDAVIGLTKRWLDIYFAGDIPDFTPPLNLMGSEFQRAVWKLLLSIPYGRTVTYGELARIIAQKRGIKKMSAQAIGGAVGRNPISVIVPCHRVLGANGNLTGYNGGLQIKRKLLEIEGSHIQ